MKPRLKRWLKVIFFIVLFTPLVLFGAFWAAVYFIDFNQYKTQLEEEFYANSGHKLEIIGDLDFKALPLSLTLGKAKVYQKPQFNSERTLVELERAIFNLSLGKLLLDKKLHLLGVELLDPKIYLVVNSQGAANWKSLATKSQDKSQNYEYVTVSYADKLKSQQQGFFDFQLKSLNIEQGEVVFENQMNQQLFHLRDWNLMAFNLDIAKEFRLQTSGSLEDIKNQETTKISLKGQGILSEDLARLELEEIEGSLSKTFIEPQGEREGKLTFNLKEVIWQSDKSLIDFHQVNLKAKGDEIELDFGFDYNEFLGNGQLRVANLNPATWMKFMEIELPKFSSDTVLTQLTGLLDFNFSLAEISLQNIDLTLDKTSLAGDVTYSFHPKKYNFNLSLGSLNLDNYAILAQNAKDEEVAYLPLAIPVTTIRNVALDGSIKIADLTAWKTNYTQLFTRVSSNFGQMRLAPFDLELYQGSLQSSFLVDTNGTTPTYSFKGRFQDVNAHDWLVDLFDYQDLSGKVSLQFNFNSYGTNLDLIKTNLDGDFNLELLDGEYLTMDLDKVLLGRSSKASDKTLLKTAEIKGQASGGFLHLQNSLIKSEGFRARVFGKVGLLNNSLDAKVNLTSNNPPKQLAFLKGISLPMKVEGTLDKPLFKLDIDEIIADYLK